MVISTGTIQPRWVSVAALYCLQKSMVWTPCGPRAVPTGGAGVAPPAGSWILTTAMTRFFGGIGASPYLGLPGIRRAYSLATWLNSSSTGVSRPKMLTRTLSLSWSSLISAICPEKSANGPSLTRTVSPTSCSSRGRLRLAGASPPSTLTCRMPSTSRRARGVGLLPGRRRPGVIFQVAAAQQVAREDLLLDYDLLAVLELDDILHRDDHLVDTVLHVHRHDPAVEVGLHLVLVAGVGVDHEPPTRLVVRADHEGLVVVPVLVELVIDAGVGLEVCLGHRLGHHF